MITLFNQRWRERRDTYRPAGETIRTSDFDVAPIAENDAKDFVVRHHYSATYPAARFRYGLFTRGQLVGAAVFSQPCSDRVLTNVFPGVTMLDAVSRASFRSQIRFRADRLTGVLVFPGHIGTIYQAFNGVYLGRGTPRSMHVLPDGTVLSPRSLQKIRAGERGWQYASELLARHGAAPMPVSAIADRDERAAWLAGALRATTRGMRHPGNHRYAWGLTRATRRQLVPASRYPKFTACVEVAA